MPGDIEPRPAEITPLDRGGLILELEQPPL
jgi:hypothetical protein